MSVARPDLRDTPRTDLGLPDISALCVGSVLGTGWMDLLLMAASSKLVASILTYPHEVRPRARYAVREPGP